MNLPEGSTASPYGSLLTLNGERATSVGEPVRASIRKEFIFQNIGVRPKTNLPEVSTERSVGGVPIMRLLEGGTRTAKGEPVISCLLYTSDAADDLLCVDLGGRRIIKKK